MSLPSAKEFPKVNIRSPKAKCSKCCRPTEVRKFQGITAVVCVSFMEGNFCGSPVRTWDGTYPVVKPRPKLKRSFQ